MDTTVDAKTRLLRILGSQVDKGSPDQPNSVCSHISDRDFPVSGLLHIAFHEILGLPCHGPFEKMAWAFDLFYQGTKISVALEKFGLRLYSPTHLNLGRVVKSLKQCCKIAEQHLAPLIASQLNMGNLTLNNQYHRFDGAYTYFRDAAKDAYSTPPPDPMVKITSYGTSTSLQPFLPIKQGGYLASSMLDVYFSKLEHTLVLMLPFTNLPLTNGELQKIVGSNWGDKYRLVFDADLCAKKLCDELTDVKEGFRNPAAHGGFLKKGASFHFHSSAGALPVLLTKTARDFEFTISMVPEPSYEEICDLFDRVDEFLESSHLRHAYSYVKSGLPVSFDARSRAEYVSAIDSGDFESFLNNQAEIVNRHANMDH